MPARTWLSAFLHHPNAQSNKQGNEKQDRVAQDPNENQLYSVKDERDREAENYDMNRPQILVVQETTISIKPASFLRYAEIGMWCASKREFIPCRVRQSRRLSVLGRLGQSLRN